MNKWWYEVKWSIVAYCYKYTCKTYDWFCGPGSQTVYTKYTYINGNSDINNYFNSNNITFFFTAFMIT